MGCSSSSAKNVTINETVPRTDTPLYAKKAPEKIVKTEAEHKSSPVEKDTPTAKVSNVKATDDVESKVVSVKATEQDKFVFDPDK